MSKPIKTKLCWNCEGSVSRSAENCPYCAVYLSPEGEDLNDDPSPIRAPYKVEKGMAGGDIPKAPYNPANSSSNEETSDDDVQEAALDRPLTGFQATFLPLIFLTTGLISLFFSLMLFLFSENGKLTLQWDGEFWYAYALFALPLLFIGWRYLEQAVDSN